jgi:hypothetical protein
MLMIEFFKRGIQYMPVRPLCSPWRPEKMMVHLPQMLTMEPSLNLMVPYTARSSSENTLSWPIMWFVAPMSRYQSSW